MSTSVPQMIGNALSQNPGIPASKDNPTECVQADGRDNML